MAAESDSRETLTSLCRKCAGDGYHMKKARTSHSSSAPSDGESSDILRGVQKICKHCRGLGLMPNPFKEGILPAPRSIRVAIAGAGIGGAALALALQHRGIETVIYERDNHFSARKQGYGLTMQQGGGALLQLGLKLTGITSIAHSSFLTDGTLLGVYGKEQRQQQMALLGEGAEAARDPVRHNFHITRQDLRAALLQGLAPGTVVWGKKLVGYVEQEQVDAPTLSSGSDKAYSPRTVRLHFSDGVVDTADVLVGADGIHSIVRKLKMEGSEMAGIDPAPLRYLGVMVVLGITACPDPLLRQRVFQTLDGTTRVYAMPFSEAVGCGLGTGTGAGRETCTCARPDCKPAQSMWQLSFPIAEAEAKVLGCDPAALLRQAMVLCGNWGHAPVRALLASTTADLVTGYPAYDRDVLTPHALRVDPCSHVTLLGDSCHPMSPFKGQGANQALLDGVELARRLHQVQRGRLHAADKDVYKPLSHGPADIPSALSLFEAEMLIRAGEKMRQSREAARYLHDMEGVHRRAGGGEGTEMPSHLVTILGKAAAVG